MVVDMGIPIPIHTIEVAVIIIEVDTVAEVAVVAAEPQVPTTLARVGVVIHFRLAEESAMLTTPFAGDV